jgi:tRNA pseudouridine38-40 synthase
LAESISNSERTLKLIIEYDGTDLCGWQRQDNGPTVQQHVEEAIRTMTHDETTILGASRTDAGVHAMGQVAIFKSSMTIPASGFRRGINTALPESIRVLSVEDVHAEFHPRFDAKGKHYRYTILNRPTGSPLLRRQSWHHAKRLNLEAMQGASHALIGEHDFSAFRASGCGAHTPRRHVKRIEIKREGDIVTIDVWGNAFLRNMVRIMAGTLADIGLERLAPDALGRILKSCDRRLAGQTAPPQGLCLIEVFYQDPE